MTILDKVALNASKYPQRIAYQTVTPENLQFGGAGSDSISWKELEEYSNRLAAYLGRTLAGKTPVVVYGHKNPYMPVCFLACVKSGRAYCPVDISVPPNRIELILREVSPELVLATEELSVKQRDILSLPSIISIIENEKETVQKESHVSGGDVFYIIFTSGSTGTPKGVQITGDCVDCFVRWAASLGSGSESRGYRTSLYRLHRPEDGLQREGEIFINQAPFSFDLSVMDLFLSLYTGGTLWALDKRVQGDMKLLLKALELSGAEVWVSTPSFAEVCLSDRKFSDRLMPKMRRFLFCGETLANHTVKRLRAVFPGAQIINTYGPTESTVAVTNIVVTDEINEKYIPLPIGKEKEGTWILIMDESGDILPDGEKGEIVIVGDTVSIGYWNNRGLTKERFGTWKIEGKEYRLYHTGDKGYRKDGLLFYCGRMDLQIKLHGYRIEIEDIEYNLMKLSGVTQAVVVPVLKEGKARSLTAYMIVDRKPEDAFTAAQEIRCRLRQHLPEYMIPKRIVFTDVLPMTANGKVDRKVLGGLGT